MPEIPAFSIGQKYQTDNKTVLSHLPYGALPYICATFTPGMLRSKPIHNNISLTSQTTIRENCFIRLQILLPCYHN